MAINIGLVGTGRIGRLHAENLASHIANANLTTVTDVNLESAQKCAADFNIPKVAQNFQEILDDDSIDAVAICSSTDTHAQFIIDAAKAGKHIFCEKPIALDLPSIDAALAAVEENKVKLMVGFNRRFHADFKRIRELATSGELGAPHLVRITSRDSGPPPVEYVKVSGGIFLDMTIHDFDMARYIIDSEVTEVYATGTVLVDPGIGEAGDVDTAVIVMHYENGAICTIDNSREAVYGYDQRVEVFGSGGMALCQNNHPNTVTVANKTAFHSSLPYFYFLDFYSQTYIEEMREFIDAVINDKTPSIVGIDGRIPLVMGLAATKSLKEGRPVKLSEID